MAYVRAKASVSAMCSPSIFQELSKDISLLSTIRDLPKGVKEIIYFSSMITQNLIVLHCCFLNIC